MSWVLEGCGLRGERGCGEKGWSQRGALSAPPRLPPPSPSTKKIWKEGGERPLWVPSPPGLRSSANPGYSIYPRHFVLAPLHLFPYPSPHCLNLCRFLYAHVTRPPPCPSQTCHPPLLVVSKSLKFTSKNILKFSWCSVKYLRRLPKKIWWLRPENPFATLRMVHWPKRPEKIFFPCLVQVACKKIGPKISSRTFHLIVKIFFLPHRLPVYGCLVNLGLVRSDPSMYRASRGIGPKNPRVGEKMFTNNIKKNLKPT